MTIVVGYLAARSVRPHCPAVRVARMHKTSLTGPPIAQALADTAAARVDAEYELWSEQLAAASAREAQRHSAQTGPTGPRSATTTAHTDRCRLVRRRQRNLRSRGAGAGVVSAAARVLIGLTADRLLHSSPVPVAITPAATAATPTG